MVLKFILLYFFTINLFAYQGEGEGKSREEAIYSALSDIASQISISIDSTTVVNRRTSTEHYSRDIQSMIRVELPKIVFRNYKILEQGKKSSRYFVRLEIDSKLLASSHAQALTRRLNLLKQKLNSYSSILKRYGILKKANIQQIWLSLELLHAIDLNYNIDSFTKQIEQLTIDKSDYLKRLSFSIQSNNKEIKSVTNNILSTKGVIGLSAGIIVLKINFGGVEKSKILAQYIGTSRVNIDIFENGELILSQNLKLTATSIIGEHYLFQNILKDFEEKFQRVIEEVL